MSAEESLSKNIAPPCTPIHAQPSTRQLLHGHSNCSSIQHFMYGVFRSSVMIDITHVSSHTATQDRHGHTPSHCWHTTHLLGSTEHPPFACSRTTQQPATAVHSPFSVHNTSSMGNTVRLCRQGTEGKTHEPELQA
eukprot:COSAG03_NODE_8975_length_754_cov_221.138931_1_plen_135_part_10